MFDDYDFKNTNKRISIRFVQTHDEPMYPWEIGGFLNKLNTVYYKYDLLNSVCSAIKHGIRPSDIFVFSNSLPLYQRYAAMNLLGEAQAARHFYRIGLPYPLVPNKDIYEYNLLYQAFREINSFLHRKHIHPLSTTTVAAAYEVLRQSGLDNAESYVVDAATERALKSLANPYKKHQSDESIGEEEIKASLTKYRTRKVLLLSDISRIADLGEDERREIITSGKRDDKRLAALLLAFFRYFERTSRPLVCARVAEGRFRVLGRSLVNKREKTGLEVKEVVRRSPLGAVVEGGVAIYQAIQQEKRAKELHEFDVERKSVELEIAKEKLKHEKLKNLDLQLSIAHTFDAIAQQSDIQTPKQLQPSFLKDRLLKAYDVEQKSAHALLNARGLVLDAESIKFIDEKI